MSRAHIARKTSVQERTRFMGYAGAVQFIGFSIVPGINSSFSFIDFTVLGIPFDEITMPGYFLAAINLGTIILCWIFFSKWGTLPYSRLRSY
ncbi:MAG: hypothetical protein IBJ10_02875 [Phycisphaerales bacterium]|nr:hypothetical protein [Phycisphaerales bacterium]